MRKFKTALVAATALTVASVTAANAEIKIATAGPMTRQQLPTRQVEVPEGVLDLHFAAEVISLRACPIALALARAGVHNLARIISFKDSRPAKRQKRSTLMRRSEGLPSMARADKMVPRNGRCV